MIFSIISIFSFWFLKSVPDDLKFINIHPDKYYQIGHLQSICLPDCLTNASTCIIVTTGADVMNFEIDVGS